MFYHTNITVTKEFPKDQIKNIYDGVK